MEKLFVVRSNNDILNIYPTLEQAINKVDQYQKYNCNLYIDSPELSDMAKKILIDVLKKDLQTQKFSFFLKPIDFLTPSINANLKLNDEEFNFYNENGVIVNFSVDDVKFIEMCVPSFNTSKAYVLFEKYVVEFLFVRV